MKVDAVLTPTSAAPALGPAGLQDASQLQAARSAAQVDMLLDVQALQVGLRAPGGAPQRLQCNSGSSATAAPVARSPGVGASAVGEGARTEISKEGVRPDALGGQAAGMGLQQPLDELEG